jgi:hypothetical protein
MYGVPAVTFIQCLRLSSDRALLPAESKKCSHFRHAETRINRVLSIMLADGVGFCHRMLRESPVLSNVIRGFCRVGLITHKVPAKGFRFVSYIASSFPKPPGATNWRHSA